MPQPHRFVSITVAAALLGTLAALPPLAAQAADPVPSNGIVRVSADPDGTQVDFGDSLALDVSADGRHVLWTRRSELWTLDRVTGARVQQDAGATSGNVTWSAGMTPSGRHVVLATLRSLVPSDINGVEDVYVRDRDTDGDGTFDEAGQTSIELVSVGPQGQSATSGNWDPEISDDGNVVTWQGRTGTAWGSSSARMWLRDRTAGTSTAVSATSLLSVHGLSGDGRLVLWAGYPLTEGLTWHHNERELILLDRTTGARSVIGRGGAGVYTSPIDPALSPDGRYIGFSSYTNELVTGDTNNRQDMFVVDRQSGDWDIANRRADGAIGGTGAMRARFASDSAYLTFIATGGGLVAGDTATFEQAYVRSLGADPVTALVATGLAGAQPDRAVVTAVAADGADPVLFSAYASNLVTGDTNNGPDAFIRTGLNLGPPPVQHELTVTAAGTGAGTVTSTPAGIVCPPTCSAAFDEGTEVAMAASPTSPSAFDGFSGDCVGTTCSVTLSADRAVTATFSAPPPNMLPVAADDRFDTTAGVARTVGAPGVLGNDSDPEGAALTAAVVTQPLHGSVSLSADGSFTYTPEAGFSGSDSFTYTATDPAGGADTATVTVGVGPGAPTDLVVWSKLGGGLWVGGPGRTPTRVLSGEAWQPSWSPDRSRIVFAADRDTDRDQWDLWIVDADGTDLRRLTDDAAVDEVPAWSPDGSRIAFSSFVDGDFEISTIAPDGTGRRQLTTNSGFDYSPAWSSDGTRLAWRSGGDIWTMDADGTDAAPLVATAAAEDNPSWSPDGTTIAYTLDTTTDDPQLRLVDVDGSDDRPVATGMRSSNPSFSPDGRYLTFNASSGLEVEVWVVALDGTGRLNISNAPNHDVDPDWGQVQIPAPTDDTPPTLTLPAPVTAEATSSAGATVSFVATAEDDVDLDPAVACSPTSGSAFSVGTTTVTCSAIDEAGNTATGTFTVTVVDTRPPTLTVPASITEQATGPTGAVTTYVATASDVADATPTVTCTPPSGTRFAIGTTTVTCTAIDDAANSVSRTFTVTVVDTTAPTLTLPSPITSEATSSSGANVTFSATAVDVVDITPTVACSPSSGTTFAIGTTTVSCTATDDTGNTTTRSFTVTVVDRVGPGVVVTAPAGGATVSGTVTLTATSTDAVGVVGVQFKVDGVNVGAEDTAAPFSVPWNCTTLPNGTHTITAVARDAAGNTTTSLVVTVTVNNVAAVGGDLVWRASSPQGLLVGSDSGTIPRLVVAGDATNPSWSPDRKFIAFESRRDGSSDIWKVEVATGALTNITTNATSVSNRQPAWSPDGSVIAFDRNGTISTIRPDGSGLSQLPINAGASSPAWSPDGTRLAFTSSNQLWVANSDGTNRVRVAAEFYVSEPSWSPDGTRIAYTFHPTGSTVGSEVVTIRVNGADRRQVTNDANADAESPSWSPDGARIAYSSNTPGLPKLWTMRADGTDRRLIPSQPSSVERTPDWGQTKRGVAPIVAVCPDYDIPGLCKVTITVPNPNPGPMPGTTVTISTGVTGSTGTVTLSPTTTTGPGRPTCTQIPGSIVCRVTTVPTGGTTFTIDVYGTGTGTWTPVTTTTCGCFADPLPPPTTSPPVTSGQHCVGGQVLFDSDSQLPLLDVFASTLDGNVQELSAASGNEEAGAVWAPSHTKFAMSIGQPGSRRIYIVNLNASGCIIGQQYVVGQPNADNYQPDWAPGGNMLAFISNRDGNHDIFRIRTNGSALVKLTNAPADDRAPSFSADGQRIVFTSRRTPGDPSADWNIWTTDINGNRNETFLSTPANGYNPDKVDYSPSFSRVPGSSTIVWHSNSGGNYDLWLMNANGSNKRRVPNSTIADEMNPDWAVGDTRIVYDAAPDGANADIWMMNANGTNRQVIASTPGRDKAPSL